MAPHLTVAEQDLILTCASAKKTPREIYDILAARRAKASVQTVNVTVIRRFLRGQTHKQVPWFSRLVCGAWLSALHRRLSARLWKLCALGPRRSAPQTVGTSQGTRSRHLSLVTELGA